MDTSTPCAQKTLLSNLGAVVGTVLITAATLLAPGAASASLLTDNVDASLMAGPDTIFDTSAVVVDDPANPEFSGMGTTPGTTTTTWSLDMLAEGFTLEAECPGPEFFEEDCFEALVDLGVELILSDLDWLPLPGKVTGVTITEALQFDVPEGTPIDVTVDVLSPSSVKLGFVIMDFGTGPGNGLSIAGTFDHVPVPEPAPLALLLLGCLVIPALVRKSHAAG